MCILMQIHCGNPAYQYFRMYVPKGVQRYSFIHTCMYRWMNRCMYQVVGVPTFTWLSVRSYISGYTLCAPPYVHEKLHVSHISDTHIYQWHTLYRAPLLWYVTHSWAACVTYQWHIHQCHSCVCDTYISSMCHISVTRKSVSPICMWHTHISVTHTLWSSTFVICDT